ncbi:hypothetical protein QTN25_008700 [Entamoeba marina]
MVCFCNCYNSKSVALSVSITKIIVGCFADYKSLDCLYDCTSVGLSEIPNSNLCFITSINLLTTLILIGKRCYHISCKPKPTKSPTSLIQICEDLLLSMIPDILKSDKSMEFRG